MLSRQRIKWLQVEISVMGRMKKVMCWKMMDGVQKAFLRGPCGDPRKRVGLRKQTQTWGGNELLEFKE